MDYGKDASWPVACASCRLIEDGSPPAMAPDTAVPRAVQIFVIPGSAGMRTPPGLEPGPQLRELQRRILAGDADRAIAAHPVVDNRPTEPRVTGGPRRATFDSYAWLPQLAAISRFDSVPSNRRRRPAQEVTPDW